jgi:hypothetical protein
MIKSDPSAFCAEPALLEQEVQEKRDQEKMHAGREEAAP